MASSLLVSAGVSRPFARAYPPELLMAVTYTCPNPTCGATLKTSSRVPAGKRVKCPKCQEMFVAEPEAPPPAAAGGGTFKLADETKPPAAAAPKPPVDDDEDADSVRKGYGVVKETEEEARAAEKHKPKFGEVQDKFKKSARGPAQGLLVTAVNLMTAMGLITAVVGLVWFVSGLWPIVFNDAALGDEELEEAIFTMVLALMTFGWGCLICYGASQMQELSSYTLAFAGAVMAVPLLVGIYAIVMLQNPRVKAGFEESEGGPDDEDEDKDKDDEDEDDDEDDEDDEDEDEEEKGEANRKKKRGKARDEEDEDEDDE